MGQEPCAGEAKSRGSRRWILMTWWGADEEDAANAFWGRVSGSLDLNPAPRLAICVISHEASVSPSTKRG